MAHADTAYALDRRSRPHGLDSLFEGFVDAAAPAGDATRAQPDPDLSERCHGFVALHGRSFRGTAGISPFLGQAGVQYVRDHVRRQMSISHPVDLHDGRQRAASQTGDLLYGE